MSACPEPAAAPPCVLLVDDDAHVRKALRRSLRRCEYELVFAACGDEALRILDARPVDVVVSDQLMPGMSGLELLAQVRERHPYAVRLMLTGHADLETALEAVQDGRIWRFLTKPWDEGDLNVAVRLAAEQREASRRSRALLADLADPC